MGSHLPCATSLHPTSPHSFSVTPLITCSPDRAGTSSRDRMSWRSGCCSHPKMHNSLWAATRPQGRDMDNLLHTALITFELSVNVPDKQSHLKTVQSNLNNFKKANLGWICMLSFQYGPVSRKYASPSGGIGLWNWINISNSPCAVKILYSTPLSI